MRKILFWFWLLLLPVNLVWPQNIPQAQGWVNDFAGVISQEYRDKISAIISELEQKTQAEIMVVTYSSIAPYSEIDYARSLFDTWKPGKKDKDNGVLIFLAVKERRWRIETGYGVEGILPDGLCGEIGRNYMVPYFKNGQYSQGLYAGTAQIAEIIAKDAQVSISKPAPVNNTSGKIGSAVGVFGLCSLLFGFFFVWNLPWPIFIGLPATLLFASAFSQASPIVGIFPVLGYIFAMVARYLFWRKMPAASRVDLWKIFILGFAFGGIAGTGKGNSHSGGFGGYSGGGGFSGGGSFGGGGGGSSGGGGAGGGF